MTRIGAIDSLRGLAILGVVAVHTWPWDGTTKIWGIDPVYLLVTSGRYGVELFFVVSGLTLALSLRKRMEQDDRPVPAYFVRRFFRLSPMYYSVLAATFLMGYSSPLEPGVANPPADLKNYLIHAGYLHGFFPDYARSLLGPAWSLTPEVMFYALLPAIVMTLRRPYQRLAFFLVSFFAADLFRRHNVLGLEPSQTAAIWVSISPFSVFFLFIAGVVLADVFTWRRSHVGGDAEEWGRVANVLLVASLFGYYWSYQHNWDPIWTWMMIVGVVLAYCLRSSWLNRVLDLRPLQHLGLVSYSIFLVHFPLIHYVRPAIANLVAGLPAWSANLLTLGLVLGLCWLVATITYRFVELPGMRLGDSLVAAWLHRSPRLKPGWNPK